MCSDMNCLSQNDKSDTSSVLKCAVPSKSGNSLAHLLIQLAPLFNDLVAAMILYLFSEISFQRLHYCT